MASRAAVLLTELRKMQGAMETLATAAVEQEEERLETALVYMGRVHTLCREFRALRGVTKEQAKDMADTVKRISDIVQRMQA